MLGPEAAAAAITTILATDLPAVIDNLVDRLELAGLKRVDRELLYPRSIRAHNTATDLPLGDWPALLVVAQTTDRLRPLDVAVTAAGRHTGHTLYGVTYRLRVFTMARGRTDELTDLARKRLTLAIREALLSRLALTVTIGTETVTGSIDPLSITEALSDVAVEEDLGTIAGAYTEFTLELLEAVTLAEPTSTPDLVEPTVVGPHPALD